MGKRFLITGGTGFFGRALLRYFAQRLTLENADFSVEVLTRNPDSFLRKFPEFASLSWLQFRAGNILELDSLTGLTAPDYILHAAADSTNGHRLSSIDRFDQIVSGTKNMLRFATVCRAKRFLLTSSGAVYGDPVGREEPICEDDVSADRSFVTGDAYASGKRVAERLCDLVARDTGLSVVVARCFAFVGEDLPTNAHFAIGNFIRDAMWSDEITVRGSGRAVRSYLHQTDLAEWLLTILERGAPLRTYNVGSDQAVSILELANLVSDVVSPGKPVRVLGQDGMQDTRRFYVPSIVRAQNELGLHVRVGLSEAIRSTAFAIRSKS